MSPSASRVEYHPSEPAHVVAIAERMRQADREEVWAKSRRSPEEGLRLSLAKSSIAQTAFIDGIPEVMFGVGDINVLTRLGGPWLLGTPAVELNFRLFLRHSRGWPEQLLLRYDTLRNVVDERNEVSKRWLRWLGFTFSAPLPIGPAGELFRVFEMRR